MSRRRKFKVDKKAFQSMMRDRLSKCSRYGGLRLLGGFSK